MSHKVTRIAEKENEVVDGCTEISLKTGKDAARRNGRKKRKYMQKSERKRTETKKRYIRGEKCVRYEGTKNFVGKRLGNDGIHGGTEP